MEDDRERAYRIEKRPPEGAYGNIIAISLAITFVNIEFSLLILCKIFQVCAILFRVVLGVA